MTAAVSVDVVILGGGIAALWTLDRLRAADYSVLLLCDGALGAGQSVAAQGIIHGGVKYAIPGFEEQALPFLAEMPQTWRDALAGRKGPDLRDARVLADQFLVHVRPGLLDGLTAGAARGSLRGASREIAAADWPSPLAGAGGRLFSVDEPVVDVPSVLAALAAANRDHIGAGAGRAPDFSDGLLQFGGVRVSCRRVILAAGAGNEALLSAFGMADVATQRRPLRQVMISGMTTPLYGHVLGRSSKPLVTVTSHPGEAGGWVWYVGGAIAEEGANRSEAEVLALAKQRLPEYFPGADFSTAGWYSHAVDRAEYGGSGRRPGDVAIVARGDVIAAWPTKLALAPRLATLIEDAVTQAIKPSPAENLSVLPAVGVAAAPWQGLAR
jgi:glycine/D-amino acid oxidase-like deaminating enzyme